MNDQPVPYATTGVDDEIDLRELFGILWVEKWQIIATTAIATFGSVVYARQAAMLLHMETLDSSPRIAHV